MSHENQMALTRRVIGLAAAGVMPAQAVALRAREILGKASEQGLQVKASDQILQRLSISVLPDVDSCKAAVAELDTCIAGLVEQRRHASVDRPRSR